MELPSTFGSIEYIGNGFAVCVPVFRCTETRLSEVSMVWCGCQDKRLDHCSLCCRGSSVELRSQTEGRTAPHRDGRNRSAHSDRRRDLPLREAELPAGVCEYAWV